VEISSMFRKPLRSYVRLQGRAGKKHPCKCAGGGGSTPAGEACEGLC